MNYRAKADLMVRRGEARTFSEACSLLAKRRRRCASKPKQELVAVPAGYRLPYKED